MYVSVDSNRVQGEDGIVAVDEEGSGGTRSSMTKAKIAVSLPPRLVQRARRAVRQGRAESVSAYVAAALEEKGKQEDLSNMLDGMLAETGGPLTDEERRAADRALGTTRKRKSA